MRVATKHLVGSGKHHLQKGGARAQRTTCVGNKTEREGQRPLACAQHTARERSRYFVNSNHWIMLTIRLKGKLRREHLHQRQLTLERGVALYSLP